MEESATNTGYGKRPMWQWILLYVLVALVLYGGFYYFFLAKKGGYNAPNNNQSYVTPTISYVSPTQKQAELLMTQRSASKGEYFADTKGLTLYIFDNDTKGVSNCTGTCLALWPPYLQTQKETL